MEKNLKTHIYQIMEKIDKETDLQKKKMLIWEHGQKPPFNMLWALNFCDRISLELPEGDPPYKHDGETNEDIFPSSLAQEIRKVGNCMTGVKIAKWKKENIFTQVCEAIPLKDAQVLVFAKDKALTELYPTITKELIAEIFPAYVK